MAKKTETKDPFEFLSALEAQEILFIIIEHKKELISGLNYEMDLINDLIVVEELEKKMFMIFREKVVRRLSEKWKMEHQNQKRNLAK